MESLMIIILVIIIIICTIAIFYAIVYNKWVKTMKKKSLEKL